MSNDNTEPAVFCRYTEMRVLTALAEHPLNPNTHPEEQLRLLADVIRGNGWRQPITVSDLSGYIIKGHGRYQAAKLAGFREVPVEVQHYENEAAEMADMLADNRIAELASMDGAMLAEVLANVPADMQALTGYTQEDIERILHEVEQLPEDPEDDVPEDVPAVTQPGDVWHLGRHRLLCGDSTRPEAVSALLEGELADLLLTDPPYNVAYEGKTKDALTIQNDSMEDGAFRKFLWAAFACADAGMRPGAAFYIWHADSEGYNFRGAARDAGWQVRQCLIWAKNTLVLGRQDYQWQHEPCLYGWKDGAAHFFAESRQETTVLEFDKPARSAEHPTMKPVALFAYLVHNSSHEGDIVLDTFAGSGTTMAACQQLGRSARLMELDPHYCDVIVQRFRNLAPGEPVRLVRDGVDVPLAD